MRNLNLPGVHGFSSGHSNRPDAHAVDLGTAHGGSAGALWASVGFVALILAALLAAALAPASLGAQEPVPSRMAVDEMDRSRNCVPVLTRLEELDRELAPLAQRVDRIGALYEAVTLEDASRVAPLDPGVAEDRLVQAWFESDAGLAARYVESGDEAVLEERRTRKAELIAGLEEAFASVSGEADQILAQDEDLPRLAGECQGAILVRPAVLELCPETAQSGVCQGARSAEPMGIYRFVDAAEILWDVEQYRPWSSPEAIRPSPEGLLAGGTTGTLTRRGNVLLSVRLEPMLRARSDISEEEAAEFDANLEEMGFQFEDPRFVMAPALVIELDMNRSLDDETLYLLHFGDLSDPAGQVFWTASADRERPIRDRFPVSEGVLARLMTGEEVSVTAVRVEGTDENQDGVPLYTLGFTSVGQEEAVTALVSYMVGGQLARDLARLVPDGADSTEPGDGDSGESPTGGNGGG
ncbi:MAG: hypothetical protein EA350_03335 [Gemmatimonadales bacterium]|nr:MAG: hypothetical protein EA350_03335 [Gemmatimonadales bacterium]